MFRTRACAALLVLGLALGLGALPAKAAESTGSASVVYSGSQNRFIITPEFDLFQDKGKDLMPGDSVTGQVLVSARDASGIELFFTAEPGAFPVPQSDAVPPSDPAPEEVRQRPDDLIECTLTLHSAGQSRLLYRGRLGGTVGPCVSLGSGNSTSVLEYTLSLPTAVTRDELLTLLDTVDWTFTAKKSDHPGGTTPADTAEPGTTVCAAAAPAAYRVHFVQTGAARHIALFGGGAAACAALLLAQKRRKRAK